MTLLLIMTVTWQAMGTTVLALAQESSHTPGFADLGNHWARESITYLAERGIVHGTVDESGSRVIRPNDPVTRAEVVKMLVMLRGLGPLPSAPAAFRDTAGHWANGYLATARVAAIVKGYPNGDFHPDARMTRAEMATMIIRGFGRTPTGEKPAFIDVPAGHWAEEFIVAAAQHGWVTGYQDGTFRPERESTRAEAFTVVARAARQREDEAKQEKERGPSAPLTVQIRSTADASGSVPSGETVELTADVSEDLLGTTYIWSASGGVLLSNGMRQVRWRAATPGIYTLRADVLSGGRTSSSEIKIEVKAAGGETAAKGPVIRAVTTKHSFIYPGTLVSVSVELEEQLSGVVYRWKADGGTLHRSDTAEVLWSSWTPGTFTLWVEAIRGSLTATNEVTLRVFPEPTVDEPGPAPPDWRAQLETAVESLAGATYTRNSQAYLDAALASFKPVASRLSTTKLTNLQADLHDAYFDQSRLKDEPALERQREMVALATDKWLAGTLKVPEALVGLTDLLMAVRQEADMAVTDAEVTLGFQLGQPPVQTPAIPGLEYAVWKNAVDKVIAARQQLNTGLAAVGEGKGPAAADAFATAWRGAMEAMSLVNLTWDWTSVTDLDQDDISDHMELRWGASPLQTDTDGDGLTDSFEIKWGGVMLLPALADTDGNGTPDGLEDADQDGLDNLAEQQVGTSPNRRDTDGDTLTDSEEVKLGTDPLAADTDLDGLADAAELRAGTDPHNPDSDGDGIPDGADEITGRVTSQQTVISITGVGDIAGTVQVVEHQEEQFRDLPGLVGNVTEVTASMPFTSARVELPVDLSRVPGGDVDQLRVYYFNEGLEEWVPVEGAQGFDAVTGRAWADTTHFTSFAVFYVPSWNEFWSVQRCKVDDPDEPPVAVDIALVLDSSGSMLDNDPQDLRKEGAKRLVRSLLEDDRAAVIDFDWYGNLLEAVTSDKALLEAAIDKIDSDGGTDIGDGMRIGLDELSQSDANRGLVMVLLTDGMGGLTYYQTERAVQMQVVVYTIGLGDTIDTAHLEYIASRTGGKFYHVRRPEDLPSAFQRVRPDSARVDSDGDGLSDCWELFGMPDANGKLWYSDPNSPDSDGDGLTDLEEIGDQVDPFANPGRFQKEPYFRVQSNPLLADSDSDGLDDSDEYENGTIRLLADYDKDGLNDYEELLHATDPMEPDTDGDEIPDGVEVAELNFDPLVPDERLTPLEWAEHYAKGVVQGDACSKEGELKCLDTIPFFLGQISGGASSMIPGIGWLVGTVADLRDSLANLLKGEWLAAGASVAGLLPVIGDAVKLSQKVISFVEKTLMFAPIVGAVIGLLPQIFGSATPKITAWVLDLVTKIENLLGDKLYPNVGVKLLALSSSSGRFALSSAAGGKRFIQALRNWSGDDETFVKLARSKIEYDKLFRAFDRLEQKLSGPYPDLIPFVREMIRKTPDEVLAEGLRKDKLTLDNSVTLNIKKLTANPERYIERVGNHIQGALGESRAYKEWLLPENRLMPPPANSPRHKSTSGNGPDSLFSTEEAVDGAAKKVLNVGESKARLSQIRVDDLKFYFDDKTFPGEIVFKGAYLDKWIKKVTRQLWEDGLLDETSDLVTELHKHDGIRFRLFTYGPAENVSDELRKLLRETKKVRLEFPGIPPGTEVELDWVHEISNRRRSLRHAADSYAEALPGEPGT